MTTVLLHFTPPWNKPPSQPPAGPRAPDDGDDTHPAWNHYHHTTVEFNLDDIPEFKPEDLKGLLEGFGDLDLEGFVDFHIPPNKDIEL